MMVPSITTLVLGSAIVAVLAAVDWFVWRMTPVRRYPLSPEGTRFAEDEATALRKVASRNQTNDRARDRPQIA